MSVFVYEAVRPSGERVTGTLDAAGRPEALRDLSRLGLQALRLDLEGARAPGAKAAAAKGAPAIETVRLRKTEVLLFTEDLADLLDAGMQLEPALRIMEERQQNAKLRTAARSLRAQVREGVSFARALGRTSASFGDLYCNLVEAGELSGSLSQILRKQAEYLAAALELQSRIGSALIYPALLVGAIVLMLVVFVLFVIPRFVGLFSAMDSDMPAIFRLLLSVRGFVERYWWLVLGGGALVVVGIWSGMRNPAGKRWWHEFQLKIPVLGSIARLRIEAQITHTLGALVTNGLPLLKTLQLTNRANPNLYLQQRFEEVVKAVEEGGSLSRALARTGALPATSIDMITVGEQTGRLGPALTKISKREEKRLTTAMERLTQLIPPVIIVIMALAVLSVAYSIFTGIYESIGGLQTK